MYRKMIVLSIVMLILSAVVAVSAFAQGEQRLRACIEPEFKGGQEVPQQPPFCEKGTTTIKVG